MTSRGLDKEGIFMALDRPQSPLGRDVTTMPTTADAAPRGFVEPRSQRFDRPSTSSTSASASRTLLVARRPQSPFWSQCADVARRAGVWMSRRRYELAPFGVTSGLTAASFWAYADGAGVLPLAVISALGAASTVGAALGLKHKSPEIARAGAGLALVFGDIATGMAAGPGPYSLIADGILTGTAYAFYGPQLVKWRHERMRLHVDTVKARGALPAAMGMEMADPGLIGASVEETALRRAIHALCGVTPLDVPVFQFNANGWAALVVMPAGRNTSPEQIVRKKQQLAANLGLSGALHLSKGDDDNHLVVRLVTSDALAGTIPYTDDGYRSMADPVRLGRDEHGQPVEITVLYRHTLIAGSSDWGKSGIVNLAIKRMTRRADVDIYGIDMKPGAVELGPWEPLMKKVAKGIEEARDLLQFIRAECDRRGAYLAALSARELAAGREPVRKWIPGVHGNGIVVFVDELAELIRQDEALRKLEAEWRKQDKESYPLEDPVAVTHESLLAIARFLAISFVEATQQPSRKVFGGNTDARGNYLNRISTRTGEPGHGQFIFGQGAQGRGWRPELLDLPGKFLAATPELENQAPRVCRAEYVSDADIAADVSHLHARSFAAATFEPEQPAAPRMVKAPPALLYPDGTAVGSDGQPELYRLFLDLGEATQEELREQGPFSSRDTVGRAIKVWRKHGVQKRKHGRAERFYLPESED